jgi:predicted patatin/cPLA2 family phospholipase
MSDLSKNALIVEGGAMRSVFSSGLLDGFLEHNFNPFDFYIGVSAGAYNLTTYLAESQGKSLQVFLELSQDKNFISYSRFLRGGHLLDLDWLSKKGVLPPQTDLARSYQHNKPFIVCATDIETGQAVYLDTNPENLEASIKASIALPLVYREFPIANNRPMTDGGIADGIPVAEAIRRGARKIMVIRSRHISYKKIDTPGHRLTRWKLRKHTHLVKTMRERIKRFEDAIQLIRNPPIGIDIIEICPPDSFSVGRFCRNAEKLRTGYEYGLRQSNHCIQRWYG